VAAARVALQNCLARQEREAERLHKCAEELWQRIAGEGVIRLGGELPGHLCLAFEGLQGESLVFELDHLGVAASTGSACSSRRTGPSHAMLAVGLNEAHLHGTLRLTLGLRNRLSDMAVLADKVHAAVARLRELSRGTLV